MKNISSLPQPSLLSIFLPVAALSLLAGPTAFAANDYWTGADSANTINWSDAGNWSNAVQTYYNEVFFLGPGGSPNNVFTVNNILDGTGGVSQMPVWQLDFNSTNLNYTTVINPGITLNLNAGNGTMTVGADVNHATAPAPANAVETITIEGTNATLSMINTLTVSQGSVQGGDSHMVTLDLSSLDNFIDNGPSGSKGNNINVATSGSNAHGTLYLAKTNTITLGTQFYIVNMANGSNSLPCAVYLGKTNYILTGSGNLIVGGENTTTNGAWLKFNTNFLGGATPPSAYFGSTNSNGRINTFYVAYANGATNNSGYGVVDFSGGNATMMVNAMQVGVSGAAGANDYGVVTLDNGTINALSATLGSQPTSAGGTGVAVMNLNTNSTYGTNGSLVVNGTLTLGSVSGTLTAGTAGRINVNGGALIASNIVNGLGAGTINVSNGSVTITGVAGSASAPISALSLTNASLQFAVSLNATNSFVANLTTSGTNHISVTSVPPLTTLPLVIKLVKYSGSIGGAGYNFGLGSLPPLCVGSISNDTANSSIDLVLTSGPLALTWTGSASGLWDFTSLNWFSSIATTYADGDTVIFPDGANTGTVSLQAAFVPGNTAVSNNALPYAFTGSGSIGGAGGLAKLGTGTLLVDNSGQNTYSGGTIISGGTVQVGTNDINGNLSGAVVDNGALVYDRIDGSLSVPNAISGSGSLTYEGGGTLQLSGNNTLTGPIFVASNSTLQAGSALALGGGTSNAVIANGATIDADGYTLTKPIVISGNGYGGEGALINSGGAVYDSGGGLAPSVTLTGDTTISIGPNRSDLGLSTGSVVLSTGGQPYNLTLNSSASYFEWRNMSVDAALANINLTGAGQWGIVGSTTLGNPTNTLTLNPGTGLTFYNATVSVVLNKGIIFEGGATMQNGGGATVLYGAMSLVPEASVYCSVNVGSTSLTFSNTISGSGTIYKQTGTSPLIIGGASPAFTGGILDFAGPVTLTGSIGSGITNEPNTLFDGTGTASGVEDISGGIVAGTPGVAGTLTLGGLILEPGALFTNNLSAVVGVGNGVNSLIQINGNLTVNNNTVYINPLAPLASSSSYTLITYTGSLNGSFGAPTIVGGGSTYTLVLTNVTTTTPKQIQLLVTGGAPSALRWNNASGNGEWDVENSANWSNLTTHVSPDLFNTFDSVTFDDTISTAANPTTAIDIGYGQVVIPSVLTNNSTTNYTISGGGKISGSASIVKLGTGTLTLSTTNDFSGIVTIAAGTLKANNGSLGGPTAAVMVTNGGTLDLNYEFGSQPLLLAGAGVNGLGALVDNDSSGNPQYDNNGTGLANIILTGNTTIGGSNRLDFGQDYPGSGTLSTRGSNYSITIFGPTGYREWANLTADTNLGNVNVMATNGSLGIKGSTTLGNPTNILGIFSNATVVLYTDNVSPVINKTMLIYGGGTLNSSANTYVLSPVILGTNTADVCALNIGTALTISNVISGPGTLSKSGGAALTLTATNTYTGSTLINAGTINLVGGGSLASTNINIPASQVLNVYGRSDQTLTLASGQLLQGGGTVNGSATIGSGASISPGGTGAIGTLTVTNTLTLAGNTLIDVNKTSGTHDTLSANSVVFGGTLTVSNLAGTLASGDSFKLFSAPAYSGAFASINPPTPGSGLIWNTSQLTASGTLSVSTGTTTISPSFGPPVYSSGNIVLSGSGGPANQTYYILSSTNLASTNWTVIATNTFSATGTFSFTNSVGVSTNAQFFELETP